MKIRRMKQHLKGAFTVDTPRKRLRMWVAVPAVIAAETLGHAALKKPVGTLITTDHPMRAAALMEAPALVLGAALCIHPYTRWAGALALTWGVLGFSFLTAMYGTDAAKQQVVERGGLAGSQMVRILRG
jgi:hypothetical protein